MNIAISCRMGMMILIEKYMHSKLELANDNCIYKPNITSNIFILKIRRNVCGVEKLPTFIIMLESISIL